MVTTIDSSAPHRHRSQPSQHLSPRATLSLRHWEHLSWLSWQTPRNHHEVAADRGCRCRRLHLARWFPAAAAAASAVVVVAAALLLLWGADIVMEVGVVPPRPRGTTRCSIKAVDSPDIGISSSLWSITNRSNRSI